VEAFLCSALLAATSLARVLKLTDALAISSSVLAYELGWARFHLR
jgi:hypothetical protein